MKKLPILALAALTLAACQTNSSKLSVSGIADEKQEGKTAYLIDQNTNEAIDSCIVTGNAFSFEINIERPQIYRTQIERRSNIILAEPGSNILVDFTVAGSGATPVTDNGGANDKKNDFMASLNDLLSKKQTEYAQMIKDSLPQEEIVAFNQKSQNEIMDIYNKCISDNKDNIFGAFMLANLAHNICPDLATLDSMVTAVTYAADMKPIEELRKQLHQKEATKEGKPFVDFKGKSIKGDEVALSDFVGKGKYVLVDFWASWCGPCRAEIPNLLAVSKEFGGDKFEVLGVNVWDNEQKFKESLKSEGIDYAQIFVPRDINATELYGISGIPQIMLIGPDGTILKRNLRGEAIAEAVKEALSK